jgi:gliding motility-associated-like protein
MYKYLLTLIFSGFVLTAFSQNLQQGIVACYPFNANANDASGNGNNGTIFGATLANDRFGKANSAYFFDGDAHISVPASKFLLNEFTYSAWVNASLIPPLQTSTTVLSIGSVGGDQGLGLSNVYFNRSEIIGYGCNTYTTSLSTGINVGTQPDVNKWYHLVSTKANGILKLYLDGVLIKSATFSNENAYYGKGILTANIGRRSHFPVSVGNWQNFTGTIDDIVIYKRVLSDAEVQQLYADGVPCQPKKVLVNNVSRCGNGALTFTAVGNSTYRWYDAPTGGNLLFEGNPLQTNLTATRSFYVCEILNGIEGERTEVTATIFPKPVITCNFPANVKAGESINYQPNISSGTSPYSFLWNLDGQQFTTAQPSLTYTFSKEDTYRVAVKVTDANGCRDSCVTQTEVSFEPFIPNVITPNGDMKNDVFTVFAKNGSLYAGKKNFVMKIYNRWGKLLMQTDNIAKGWNGSEATNGMYFYHILFGEQAYTGWVNLLK